MNQLKAILRRITGAPLAVGIFVVAMITTVIVWEMAYSNMKSNAQARFENYKQILVAEINSQMHEYEQALRGAVGLFNASDDVTRTDWKYYVDTLKIKENYPGIQGMGYISHVTKDSYAKHIGKIHEEGFIDYEIYPAGDRPVYAPITYLEPFDWRNQRAFGFDMNSERTRREALETAKITGEPAVTEKLILSQETAENTQVGFLMFLPVYEKKHSADMTKEERESIILGYVYSPFRMKDFMNSIMDATSQFIDVKIYDSEMPTAYTLMYDSQSRHPEQPAVKRPLISDTLLMYIGQQIWTLELDTGKPFEQFVESDQASTVLFAGTIISMLLFWITWTITTSRERAVALADKMTKDLRVSEERYALAVSGSNDGLWDWNIKEDTVYYAPRFKKLLSYRESEIDNRRETVEKLIHPDDYDNCYQAFQNHLKQREPLDVECRMQLKNGDYAWFRVKGQAIWDQSGKPIRMAGSLSDINDNKLAALYLQKQKVELELANKYKSEFLANMSHELRTPLNSIMVLSNLLADDTKKKLTDKQREQATIIYRSGAELLELINEVLDLSKIEAGRMEIHEAPMNVRDFSNEIKIMFEAQATERNLTFEVKVDAGLPQVISTDHKRVYQVIKNLCSNAVKFTHEGGITVKFKRPKSLPNINEDLDVKDTLAISVNDTGEGIPQDKLELIFQAFTQVDGTTTRKYGGTGLGLTISRELAQLLGGGISVESHEGKGSTFTLYIPMKSAEMTEKDEVDSASESVAEPFIQNTEKVLKPRGRKPEKESAPEPTAEPEETFEPLNAKVLIVDDDIRNIYALTALFERHQCEVVSVENGEEALNMISKRGDFDFIIMDMMMPVMDGYTATRKLKANPDFHIPIIALTAKAMPEDEGKCLRAGADEYLAKPVKRTELIPIVKKHLAKFRGTEEGAS